MSKLKSRRLCAWLLVLTMVVTATTTPVGALASETTTTTSENSVVAMDELLSTAATTTTPAAIVVTYAGHEITILEREDRHFNWFETESGYLVAFDDITGNWRYAFVFRNQMFPGFEVVGRTLSDTVQVHRFTRNDLTLIEPFYAVPFFDPGLDITSDFTDPLFADTVRYLAGLPAGAPIHWSMVAGVGFLELEGYQAPYQVRVELFSIEGIERFISLRGLVIYGTYLSHLDMRGNSLLTHLDVRNNRIGYLNISHNNQLRVLNVSNNELTSLNLAGSPQLVELDISNNRLMFLDVSGTSLMGLWATQNFFPSINYIVGWESLGLLLNSTFFFSPQRVGIPQPTIPLRGRVRYGTNLTIRHPLFEYGSSRDGGVTIRFTTDGSTPNEYSPVYTEPIPVTGSWTVVAVAFLNSDDAGVVGFTAHSNNDPDGRSDSVASSLYLIAPNVVINAPRFDTRVVTIESRPADGSIGDAYTANIYFTLNGSDPLTSGERYVGGIPISAPAGVNFVTIRAIDRGTRRAGIVDGTIEGAEHSATVHIRQPASPPVFDGNGTESRFTLSEIMGNPSPVLEFVMNPNAEMHGEPFRPVVEYISSSPYDIVFAGTVHDAGHSVSRVSFEPMRNATLNLRILDGDTHLESGDVSHRVYVQLPTPEALPHRDTFEIGERVDLRLPNDYRNHIGADSYRVLYCLLQDKSVVPPERYSSAASRARSGGFSPFTLDAMR